MTAPLNSALRLASTAIPVRERSGALEILMVERNKDLSFGGMWAFPGGAIEAGDGQIPEIENEDTNWGAPQLLSTAANAAVRETREETNLSCSVSSLAWLSHWIPPKTGAPKRFATWFFVAPEVSGVLEVDQRENSRARWITAGDALDLYAGDEFPMAAPTWCTLHDLGDVTEIGRLIDHIITQGPRIHHTRAFATTQGRMLVWNGDSAYESGDLLADGSRNRMLVDDTFSVIDRERLM